MASVGSDSVGNYSATFLIRLTTAGKHKVAATDGVNSATGVYTLVPNLSLSLKSAKTGKIVTETVSGTGYAEKIHWSQSTSMEVPLQRQPLTAMEASPFHSLFQ